MATGASSTTFSTVASYVSGATTATIVTSDGIVAGGIYKFRFYATNAKGDSDPSDEITVAATDLPDASAMTLTKITASSTQTTITISWSDLVDGTSPGGSVLGYILTAKDYSTGTCREAFNGQTSGAPDQT